mmetsp:Transcript_54748/g.123267  ORF Transcript_54748/g.123267 Transcript_54748/m.123267 type:complete len:298 (+) Transcript_54748:71-964(+)
MSLSRDSSGSDVILQGETSKRVTVPMPRNLAELQGHASRHFGGGDRGKNPKMYHRGDTVLHHPTHINRVQDGDVIVVEAKPRGPSGPPNITTQMADYVPHPLEAKPYQRQARELPKQTKFDGATSYANDFVEHPLEARKPFSPVKSTWGGQPGKTGKSIYDTHFPWHPIEPRMKHNPDAGEYKSTPFEGNSSYKNDFVKHPIRPRSLANHDRPKMGASAPFQGTTTYNNDYLKFQVPRTAPAKMDYHTLGTGGAPFQGGTEYNREFIAREQERRPIVHLEPEARRFRTQSSPAQTRR